MVDSLASCLSAEHARSYEPRVAALLARADAALRGPCAACGRADVSLRAGWLTLHDRPDGAACDSWGQS